MAPVVGRGVMAGEAQPLESTRPAASQDSSLGTVEQRPAGEERTVGAMPRLPVEEHGATLLVDPADDDLPVLELDEIELEVIDDP